MVEKTLTSIWDNAKEKALIPFFAFDKSNEVVITFDRPVRQLPVKEINGCYGLNHYLECKCNGDVKLLRIDSVRLRSAITEICKGATYPLIFKLKREGEGFKTNYICELIKTQ